jgi:hypothetical protein
MIREILSCSKEDYSFYVKCDCGREILQFYFYEDGGYCEPIIGINYFGHISSTKSLTYDRSLILKPTYLTDFIKAVEDESTNFFINDSNHYFTIKHELGGFIHFIRAANEQDYEEGKYLWDITIHNTVKEELIKLLRYYLLSILHLMI